MLTLEDIRKGAILEQFNYELMQLANNSLDPNTDATRARKVQLTIKIKPDKDREVGKLEATIKTDFAPQSAVETNISFGHDSDGCATISEFGAIDPNRAILPEVDVEVDNKTAAAGEDDSRAINNVTPLSRAGGIK